MNNLRNFALLLMLGGLLLTGGDLVEAKKTVKINVATSTRVTNKKHVTKAKQGKAVLTEKPLSCLPGPKSLPVNADLDKLRSTWLGWDNQLREKSGLSDYVEEPKLELSATVWSDRAVQRGTITHKRDGQKAYYDYKLIGQWFKNLGLEFKNIHRATFTENIGWGVYKCPTDPKADCTEAMTKAIRTTFDFFAGEKNRKYRPHYDSLMKPEFERIGMGLALDTVHHKYYLTVHYGTEITSKELPICQ